MSKIQESNATRFLEILRKSEINPDTNWDHRKLKAEGYMDLSIDRLLETQSVIRFAIAHNVIQNGDVMADPDMEIELSKVEPRMLRAKTYQNSFAGVFTAVDHVPERAREACQSDLDEFLAMWLRNILDQGHKLNG